LGLPVRAPSLGSFGLSHAIYKLGLRYALIFLAIVALVSLVFEAVGGDTIEGDIHEIGKSLVGTMLSASGF